MSEREGTPENFAAIFRRRPETEAKNDDEKAELSNALEDPEQAHNAFLVELFHGSPQKREADRKFFEGLSGLTEEEAG
jgi:hypothetical protein